MNLDEIYEAFEECGLDSTMPIVFRYDGLTLDVGEIVSNDATGNSVHFIMEED